MSNSIIIKWLGLSILIAGIIVPTIHALLIPWIDQSIYPYAPSPTGTYNTFHYVWFMTLWYYSFNFLWTLFLFGFVTYWVGPGLMQHWVYRLMLYATLHLLVMYFSGTFGDYFRIGGAGRKWGTLLSLECILLSLIPMPKIRSSAAQSI